MSAELPVMIEISYSFLLGELKRKRINPLRCFLIFQLPIKTITALRSLAVL
jgi:hypothetical protein